MTPAPDRPLSGRVALVTGASRGIGQATAVALGRLGARCVILARTVGGLEQTDDRIRDAGGPAATLLPIDLAGAGGVDALGPTIAGRFGRLDILVHAAADHGPPTPLAHATETDWLAATAVSMAAGWRLIRTTTPLLAAAPDGRALFLSDPVARAPRAFLGLLAAGKAGLEALVESWRAEMAGHPGLRISVVDPGPAATRLRARIMPGERPEGLPDAEQAGTRIAALCLPGTPLTTA